MRARESGERDRVVEGNPVPVGEPGERSIHRAGVEVVESELPGDLARDRALPRAGQPVDGDDHVAGG